MCNLDVAISIYNNKNFLLKNVNFTLSHSHITALIGTSGSGKSLSAMAIFGMTPNGYKSDIKISQPKEKISIIMQNPRTAFNPLLSIHTHAKESIKSGTKNKDELIKQVFNDVGLGLENLKKYPFELSGGMLQRAMIALALLKQPHFIIADEPTTDLDLITQNTILELLLELKTKKNIGILLITHDFGVVKKMADDVLVMSNGEIVERGNINEIFNHAKHRATQNLLNAYSIVRNA
ncbi:Nickel import ATP-binding protein NikD [Campylobacter majalis]|uniref:Nickel import ATP-binding protein NikD n=1 Tax=Campylobacter majalis TaxID=2790656 RepID=A0ABM8Q5G1_9BACT|nr:ATP-binding cassette domain-containing protein [Campylobacter majalis]CAD7288139.1 Nickel import ATP-binding protein NikD [Campylobacter majalis]